jgi:molybdopterin-guanine dinucleotide biosynthesis protein A
MPYINVILLKYIFKKYSSSCAAVVPMFHKEPQPLLSIYSESALCKMKESIQQGKMSIRRFLQKIQVLYISEEEVRSLDPEGRAFVNINTLEDYHREIGGKLCLV